MNNNDCVSSKKSVIGVIVIKNNIRAIAILILIAALLSGMTGGQPGALASASVSGTGVLEKIVIPADGLLFMPEQWATRGTVVLALYNTADNEILQDTGTGEGQSGGASYGARGGFSDVAAGSRYYAAIGYFASKGYISGYPDGTFKPEGSITRAEICAILDRVLSLEAAFDEPLPDDVPPEHWAAGSILAVIKSGIMSGYDDKTFRLETKLTRAELAAITVKARGLKQPGTVLEFADVPETHWAYKYVACVSVPDIPDPSQFETEVSRLVNSARVKAGLKELSLDPFLCEVARIKARDMIKNDYFSHISPKWGDPEEMLDSFGASFYALGENIARGQRTPDEVMKDWTASPGHNSNILGKGYSKTGIGCAEDGSGAIFWVQIFVG